MDTRPHDHFHTVNIWQHFCYTSTFRSCVSINSKEFHIFLIFGRNFDAQILKRCKIHWKLRIKQIPVLFCKYLRNESSDLYMVVNYYLVSLFLKFHEDPCINARAWVANARAHVLSRVCALMTPVRTFVHGSPWNLKVVFTIWYLTSI